MLISDDDAIRDLLQSSRRVAVLGIKPESRSHKPAHYVPRYLVEAGYEVIPVPVYYPEVREILGRPVYRSLVEIPGTVDIVDVFRRPEHLAPHVPDILAKMPRAVWLQSGIKHAAIAAQLAAAGIIIVQDRCMLVEDQRFRDIPG